MTSYTTKAGDMWDAIAYAVYGSCSHTAKLMKANSQYAKVYFFPAGVILTVPELTETDVDASFVPPWRR